MTLLCAPIKNFQLNEKVDLVEMPDKTIYQQQKLRFIDVDWQTPTLPAGSVIVSYHNHEETPDLEEVLKRLQERHPNAHYYKIAAMANSTLDSLRMLTFLQKHPKVIGLCMGDLGTMTRICAPIFEVPIMYAPLREEDKNAPGQLLVDQLQEIYHFKSLNPQTQIFGLIGDPVFRSIGHLFHNDVFRKEGKNCVYIKMALKASELPEFFAYAKKLPIRGLSVTAPLKEAVLPFIDEIDPQAQIIGAVNTLLFENGKVYGWNTDAAAAVDALGNVRKKRLVILGAGGSARAIAYMAHRRGAQVIIVNRTPSKAKELANLFNCDWSPKVPPHDILVNATSATLPIAAEEIEPGKLVMDIALYETEFLKIAKSKNCSCLDGFTLYFQQAAAQQHHWSIS